jgi:dienelactone hydrolase
MFARIQMFPWTLALAGAALLANGCADTGPAAPLDFDDVELPEGFVLQDVEFVNDHGETIKALYGVPDVPAPMPAVIVLHGAGGLFDPPDDDDEQAPMGPQFEEWAALLYSRGYAVLLPDSFSSRGFYEWTEHPDELDKQDRLVMRAYDAQAALAFACDQPEIDCGRVAALGFSNGGSVAALSVHERLNDIDLLSDLTPADERPRFALSIPYYPGCEFDGLLSTDLDDPSEFYRPTAPVYVQHAEDDRLLDGCEDRLDQTEALTELEGLSENPFHLHVYSNAGHSFDSDPGSTAERNARLEARQVTLDLLASEL